MTQRSYAFWNNKGGVGKSYLSFVTSCEYAALHPDENVFVIDLCPQANASEILLGGYDPESKAINALLNDSPRRTIGGYLEARLNSPFERLRDVKKYVSRPYKVNPNIPQNVFLVAGDGLLEVLSEPMRQASSLSIPFDAWAQVIRWVKDLIESLEQVEPEKQSTTFIDCNPSFAIYTQMAIAASTSIVVPFTGDDSSRRAIQNVIGLVYGIGEKDIERYARISFAQKARDEGVALPKLDTFVSDRVTLYEGKPSKAFLASSERIKKNVENVLNRNKRIFENDISNINDLFVDVPDYHSACIVSATSGLPLRAMKAGPHQLEDKRVQINKDPLKRYTKALDKLVNRL